jgi:hypothetical protein
MNGTSTVTEGPLPHGRGSVRVRPRGAALPACAGAMGMLNGTLTVTEGFAHRTPTVTEGL